MRCQDCGPTYLCDECKTEVRAWAKTQGENATKTLHANIARKAAEEAAELERKKNK